MFRAGPLLMSTLMLVCACGPMNDDDTDGGTGSGDAGMLQPVQNILVRNVIDGDTLIVSATGSIVTPDGKSLDDERIRLLGIDAPEVAHNGDPADCWGDESAEFLTGRVQGRLVTIEYDTTKCSTRMPSGCRGDFGRLLAYIKVGAVTVNEEILSMGHARTLGGGRFTHRDSARYASLEDDAQRRNLGMWSCP